jgi:hypothetical protein
MQKMKQVLISIFLVLVVLISNASIKKETAKSADNESQATMVLSGTIADNKSGESLVGVEVKIEGTDLITYTDFDGNFSFEGVKKGEYKLVTNYISYQKQSKLLNLNSKESKVKIELEPSN